MADTNNTERAALIELIDAYSETRHTNGHFTYNSETAAARDAVLAALAPSAGDEPDRAMFDLWYADHIGDENKTVRNAAWETYQAFARPQPPEAREGWMPIETAPKDGTEIGVISAEAGVIRRVRWDHHLGNSKQPMCWVTVTKSLAISHLPTHWMPLPPPPSGASKEVGNADQA